MVDPGTLVDDHPICAVDRHLAPLLKTLAQDMLHIKAVALVKGF